MKRFVLGAVLGAIAALLSAVGHGGEASRTMAIDLSPGTSKVIGFDAEVGAAFIADPATADVNVLDSRTLFVLGIAPGITSLKVHDANGELLAAYAVRVNAQTEYANTVIERVVGDAGDVRVESVGNALFVSGSTKSPAQAELLLRGIRAVSGAPVVDALTTATPPQVNLDVMISEVSRNVTRELGIDWSIDLNPFEIPLRTWATGTGLRLGSGALQLDNVYDQVVRWVDDETGEVIFQNDVSELGVVMPYPRGSEGGVVLSHTKEINSSKYRATAFIEALAQNGLVTVHARPSLTTVSGEPAEFFSGLEVPVPTLNDRGVVATEYHQTGVSLSFTPTVLDERSDFVDSAASHPRDRRWRRDHRRRGGAEHQRTLGVDHRRTRQRRIDRHRGALSSQYHGHRQRHSGAEGHPGLGGVVPHGEGNRSIRRTHHRGHGTDRRGRAGFLRGIGPGSIRFCPATGKRILLLRSVPMTEKRSKSTCRHAVRQLLLAGSAMLLASCTVAVSKLAPDPPNGEYLSLVQEVMAESANLAEPSDSPRAEQAVKAVAAWRGASESEGETIPGLPAPSP